MQHHPLECGAELADWQLAFGFCPEAEDGLLEEVKHRLKTARACFDFRLPVSNCTHLCACVYLICVNFVVA